MFKVQRKQCRTCIYRRDSPLDIEALEKAIADPYMGFKGFRICHHSKQACCRGFWDRHKDEFQAGQVAQRLNMVQFVMEDRYGQIKKRRVDEKRTRGMVKNRKIN